jgi:hypothetical protein
VALDARCVQGTAPFQRLPHLPGRRCAQGGAHQQRRRLRVELVLRAALQPLARVEAQAARLPAEGIEELLLDAGVLGVAHLLLAEGAHAHQDLLGRAHAEPQLCHHLFALLPRDATGAEEVLLEALAASVGAHRHGRAVAQLDAALLTGIHHHAGSVGSLAAEPVQELGQRALVETCVERAAVARVHLLVGVSLLPACEALDGLQQLRGEDRLAEEVAGAELQGACVQLRRPLGARQDHHRYVRVARPHLCQQVEAVETAQQHLEQDEIDRAVPDGVQRPVGVVGVEPAIPETRQLPREAGGEIVLVVYVEDESGHGPPRQALSVESRADVWAIRAGAAGPGRFRRTPIAACLRVAAGLRTAEAEPSAAMR